MSSLLEYLHPVMAYELSIFPCKEVEEPVNPSVYPLDSNSCLTHGYLEFPDRALNLESEHYKNNGFKGLQRGFAVEWVLSLQRNQLWPMASRPGHSQQPIAETSGDPTPFLEHTHTIYLKIKSLRINF